MRKMTMKETAPVIGIVGAGLLLVAIILLLMLRSFQARTDMEEAPRGSMMLDARADKAEGGDRRLAELLSDREVYFAGIEDATIGRTTEIYLENMAENDDILMQYVITDKGTGEVYEETGLIPAGEHIAWVPGEVLENGSYTLIFHERPFYPYEGEMIALTQGNNEVTITIQ